MKKIEPNLSVEQLQEEIKLNEQKYQKAVADNKNYAILKSLKRRISKLKESLEATISS